MFVLVSK